MTREDWRTVLVGAAITLFGVGAMVGHRLASRSVPAHDRMVWCQGFDAAAELMATRPKPGESVSVPTCAEVTR